MINRPDLLDSRPVLGGLGGGWALTYPFKGELYT
jgi:hypothetical protein